MSSLAASHGAQLEAPLDDHNTLLIMAASHGLVKLVYFLIEQKVKLDVVNEAGDTALTAAIKGSQMECVHLLLHKGANCNLALPKTGETALHIATKGFGKYPVNTRQWPLITLLLHYGADKDACDASGQRPLEGKYRERLERYEPGSLAALEMRAYSPKRKRSKEAPAPTAMTISVEKPAETAGPSTYIQPGNTVSSLLIPRNDGDSSIHSSLIAQSSSHKNERSEETERFLPSKRRKLCPIM